MTQPVTLVDGVVQLQLEVQIPETVKDLGLELDKLGGALAAGGWATAAAVYAWTEPEESGGRPRKSDQEWPLNLMQFAALKLRGLSKRDTVRKYRRRWEIGVEQHWLEPVKPGQRVKLPPDDFTLPRGSTDPNGDEWFTPGWIFEGLGLTFSIDVCAPADGTHVSTPAELFYTEDDDGLVQKWWGTVWCNPPYSDPAPWAERMVAHCDGMLLSHIPINGGWCMDVWAECAGIRLFQAIEFVRPDGTLQRPGYWLQLAAFGDVAGDALAGLVVPDWVADNPRRVPSPMWRRA